MGARSSAEPHFFLEWKSDASFLFLWRSRAWVTWNAAAGQRLAPVVALVVAQSRNTNIDHTNGNLWQASQLMIAPCDKVLESCISIFRLYFLPESPRHTTRNIQKWCHHLVWNKLLSLSAFISAAVIVVVLQLPWQIIIVVIANIHPACFSSCFSHVSPTYNVEKASRMNPRNSS